MKYDPIQNLNDRIFSIEVQRDRLRFAGKLSQDKAQAFALELGLLREELRLRLKEQGVLR
jgi:hypothetical protein